MYPPYSQPLLDWYSRSPNVGHIEIVVKLSFAVKAAALFNSILVFSITLKRAFNSGRMAMEKESAEINNFLSFSICQKMRQSKARSQITSNHCLLIITYVLDNLAKLFFSIRCIILPNRKSKRKSIVVLDSSRFCMLILKDQQLLIYFPPILSVQKQIQYKMVVQKVLIQPISHYCQHYVAFQNGYLATNYLKHTSVFKFKQLACIPMKNINRSNFV